MYSTARQIPQCKTPLQTNMSQNWSKCTNFPAAGGSGRQWKKMMKKREEEKINDNSEIQIKIIAKNTESVFVLLQM